MEIIKEELNSIAPSFLIEGMTSFLFIDLIQVKGNVPMVKQNYEDGHEKGNSAD